MPRKKAESQKTQSDTVTVEVLVGSLMIEWPPLKGKEERCFSKGEKIQLPRKRAEQLDRFSAKILG